MRLATCVKRKSTQASSIFALTAVTTIAVCPSTRELRAIIDFTYFIESPMAAELKKEIELEIAHVLFLDIVGYSKLSVKAQVEEG